MARWNVTAVDYEAPLFSNSEARLGTGIGPALWAKWLHRGLIAPSRPTKSGRGGLYAGRKIFEIRVMNLVGTEVAIPASEAQEIADLATKGTWNSAELKTAETNWRRLVIRDNAPPLDVYLLFSRTENCWGYEEALAQPEFKNSATLVLAAARELIAVSKYCWSVLEETGRTTMPRMVSHIRRAD